MTDSELLVRTDPGLRQPRIGFVGTGWIGLNRMRAMVDTGAIVPAAIVDPSAEMLREARAVAPEAEVAASLEDLLAMGLDGVVVATPSALHADQSLRALEAGMAVFCQKPLGRTAEEVSAVVETARRMDRLLGVDFSYRHTEAMRRIFELIGSGELGPIHAVDLVFHNAYGPDKPWFYDPALSGGGCLMDLGVHLVDLALWCLGFPAVEQVDSCLFSEGRRLGAAQGEAEDYAIATLQLSQGTVVRLACSWRLPAGCDAVISAEFYGTKGGAAFRNVNGSFYDFVADRFRGTARERLADPPDAWGGRAAARWARQLADCPGFDASAEELPRVAEVVDRIYGR